MVLFHLDTVYVTRRSYMFIPKTLNMVPVVPLFSTHIKRQTLALSNVYIYSNNHLSLPLWEIDLCLISFLVKYR